MLRVDDDATDKRMDWIGQGSSVLRKNVRDPILCIYLLFFLSPRWGFFSVGSILPIHPGGDGAAVVGCHQILHEWPFLVSLLRFLRFVLHARPPGDDGRWWNWDDVKAPQQQGTVC
jgi:hypothetical protein